MWIIQDFECNTCHKIDEFFVSREDKCMYVCSDCGSQMHTILSPTKGYVIGTDNPVKQ